MSTAIKFMLGFFLGASFTVMASGCARRQPPGADLWKMVPREQVTREASVSIRPVAKSLRPIHPSAYL